MARRLGGRLIVSFAVLAGVLAGVLAAEAATGAGASHSVLHLPAPAGSKWQIVAGYNTVTHTGVDPYAIDIVRTDAATAGTPVLAPIGGTVRWASGDCVTIRDDHGLGILMCHLFADDGLYWGRRLTAGDRIGVVAPAGYAGNNGLAHIHLAVQGGGSAYGDTIALAGRYALEGRDLPATSAPNAYAGQSFRSTNGPLPPPRPRTPGLESFRLGASGNHAALGWTASDTATSFEFCSSATAAELHASCRAVAGPLVDVSWDTVLDGSATADDPLVFTSGWVYTALRACNVSGCSSPGAGPQVGGLRWGDYDIDFDYMAIAFDFGSLQFTIGIVVNVSGPPRTFTIANGPPDDPNRSQLNRCRLVQPGRSCIAFLRPGEGEHYEIVSIVSEDEGKPTTEHRLRVR